MSSLITHELLKNAMGYPLYVEMVRDLCVRRETTVSSELKGKFWVDMAVQSLVFIEELLQSAKLNETTLNAIQKQEMPLIWIAITETWCLDSAHSLPIVYKMSEANPNINMKVILRDEAPNIIDNFLTHGSKSIPKIICLDAESLVVLSTWGPRPIELQVKMMLESRAYNKLSAKERDKAVNKENELILSLKKWYEEDKTERIQAEVIQTLLY